MHFLGQTDTHAVHPQHSVFFIICIIELIMTPWFYLSKNIANFIEQEVPLFFI